VLVYEQSVDTHEARAYSSPVRVFAFVCVQRCVLVNRSCRASDQISRSVLRAPYVSVVTKVCLIAVIQMIVSHAARNTNTVTRLLNIVSFPRCSTSTSSRMDNGNWKVFSN
jgi:hypothetical protein